MALTVGNGPFSPRAGARLNAELDRSRALILWDPVPERVRVLLSGELVVDSDRAVLLHETGHLPVYYFPHDDLRHELLEPSEKRTHCPHKGDARYWSVRVGERVATDAIWSYPEPVESAPFLAGFYALVWNAFDEWFAEEEQVFGHPRDPYHRIDICRTTRHVRVLLDGEIVADTLRAKILFEASLPPRYYIPLDDVRGELLATSAKKTRCAYKGAASYWHVQTAAARHDDIVWTYRDPHHDAERVRDMLCFFNERVDLELDGEPVARPQTEFSR